MQCERDSRKRPVLGSGDGQVHRATLDVQARFQGRKTSGGDIQDKLRPKIANAGYAWPQRNIRAVTGSPLHNQSRGAGL